MRSVSIAEWMLSRFTSVEQASSHIGDLEELRPQKGGLWFWSSLAGFLFLLCWRRFVALAAAFYLGSRFFQAFQFVIPRTKLQHPRQELWMSLFPALTAVGYFLWMTSIYAAIRYGLRDKMTQLSLLWSGIVSAIFVSWWHPAVLYFSIALGALQVFLSMAKPAGRKRLLVLAATLGSGFVSYLLVIILFSVGLSTLQSITGLYGSRMAFEHPSIFWIFPLLTFMAAWTTTAVFSRMHRWVSQSEESDGPHEPDLA